MQRITPRNASEGDPGRVGREAAQPFGPEQGDVAGRMAALVFAGARTMRAARGGCLVRPGVPVVAHEERLLRASVSTPSPSTSLSRDFASETMAVTIAFEAGSVAMTERSMLSLSTGSDFRQPATNSRCQNRRRQGARRAPSDRAMWRVSRDHPHERAFGDLELDVAGWQARLPEGRRQRISTSKSMILWSVSETSGG